MNHPQRTIAILGAGFSGTAVAIHLLQRPAGSPLRVVLLDRETTGRGLAYADRGYPYLLNVPAGRMSANADEPLDFLNFAQTHIPTATAHDFLPRSLYGEYLQARLLAAERAAAPDVVLERIFATAVSIKCGINDRRYCVRLADGRSLFADDAVVALGNPPCDELPGSERLRGSPSYIADPWSTPPTFQSGERILVVGTGLTMADVVTAGFGTGGPDVQVHAISRHGLLPPSQTATSHGAVQIETRRLLEAASFSTRALFHAIRELCAERQRSGGDWREIINVIRGLTPQLWQRMPQRERQRFLRHVRAYWDIHRHRLPGQTLAELEALRAQRRLTVRAGRIQNLEPIVNGVRVTWQPRGTNTRATLLVDRVINCTGPHYDPRRSRNPLMMSLLAQGLAVPDALGLGVRTTASGALIDRNGRAASGLYYVGPMLRSDHWESTAVPELREHAMRLAHHLVSPVFKQTASL